MASKVRQQKQAKGNSSKRQKTEPPFDPALLGNLWMDEIFKYVPAAQLLKLPSTCRFFKQLFDAQPNGFWAEQCRLKGYPLRGRLAVAEAKQVFIAHTLKRCYLCHAETRTYSDLAYVPLCAGCRGQPPFETISPTMAQKVYHLKYEDLAGLHRITYNNQLWRRQLCELFLRSDVEARAYEHYGSREAWLAADAKSQARKAKLAEGRVVRAAERAAKQAVAEQRRRAELTAALAAKGLELRSDSKLCDEYIEGECEYSLTEIVHIMFQMKVLYEECDFQAEWNDYFNANFVERARYWDNDYMCRYGSGDIRRARHELEESLFHKWKLANPERYQQFLNM